MKIIVTSRAKWESVGKFLEKKAMYDSKCHDLAEAFLEEEGWMRTPNNLKELAQRIQNAIEDFIDELRAEKEREEQ